MSSSAGCCWDVKSQWALANHPLSLLGVTSGSSGFHLPVSPQACSLWVSVSECELGGKSVHLQRRQMVRGQISTSTGLISPVLFSRTHSSLSLAGSTHCRSWSTGSIVCTRKEQQSVEASPNTLRCLLLASGQVIPDVYMLRGLVEWLSLLE